MRGVTISIGCLIPDCQADMKKNCREYISLTWLDTQELEKKFYIPLTYEIKLDCLLHNKNFRL